MNAQANITILDHLNFDNKNNTIYFFPLSTRYKITTNYTESAKGVYPV